MKRFATTFSLFLAALALSIAPSLALAITSEPAEHGDDVQVNYLTGSNQVTPNSAQALSTIYDNTAGTTLLAFSSTDLASIWGDECVTTAPGTLSEFKFSIYNSGSSLGSLLTANCTIQFYDASTSTYLGGFTTNVNFGAGLAKGFFSTITVTALDPLAIVLNTTDIIVTQKVNSKTGTANRLGFVSKDPVGIGSSGPDFYAASTTLGSPGWYTSGSGNVNPIYTITAADLPVPAQNTSWGRIKSLYR